MKDILLFSYEVLVLIFFEKFSYGVCCIVHGLQVEMSGCKGPITTFIVEPFIPHNEEYYLNIVSDRLGCSVSFSECGGIEIEENWDKVLLSVFNLNDHFMWTL